MSEKNINSTITIPCGIKLKNRLVKAAMTERISNNKFEPTQRHERLYEAWSDTGAGLLISGNIPIDRIHLESLGNVVFDHEGMLPKLRRWAEAGKKNGTHFWIQISHGGRQSTRFATMRPKAPSEVQLKKIGLFGKPRAMTEEDIQEVIKGFVKTAKMTKLAGFTGLQIHSAHGYLLSQFLSPNTNKRTDQWGGSLKNRSRLLLTIVREVRKEVGAEFPVSVKLNSADFQRGGFTEEESLEVIQMLDREGIDLLEISGGTYEKLVFFLQSDGEVKKSTSEREAYFIDFAKKVRAVSKVPLMITGGFRSYDFCNEVLQKDELDLIGMARPFLTNCDEIGDFLEGKVPMLKDFAMQTGIKQFNDSGEAGYYTRQIIQIAEGRPLKLKMNALLSSVFLILHEMRMALVKKR